MFLVLQADNVSYDIEVSKPFNTRKEAEKHLKEVFDNLVESYDEEEVISAATNCKKCSFVVTTVGTDVYYGSVKEVK